MEKQLTIDPADLEVIIKASAELGTYRGIADKEVAEALDAGEVESRFEQDYRPVLQRYRGVPAVDEVLSRYKPALERAARMAFAEEFCRIMRES